MLTWNQHLNCFDYSFFPPIPGHAVLFHRDRCIYVARFSVICLTSLLLVASSIIHQATSWIIIIVSDFGLQNPLCWRGYPNHLLFGAGWPELSTALWLAHYRSLVHLCDAEIWSGTRWSWCDWRQWLSCNPSFPGEKKNIRYRPKQQTAFANFNSIRFSRNPFP